VAREALKSGEECEFSIRGYHYPDSSRVEFSQTYEPIGGSVTATNAIR